jgi:hypothetical protein
MKHRGTRRSTFPAHFSALLIACLLVLQFSFGAFAAGANSAPPQLDAFGNPLCLSGTADGGGKVDHGSATHGCAFHCLFASLTPGAPPANMAVVLPRPASSALLPLPEHLAAAPVATAAYASRAPPIPA